MPEWISDLIYLIPLAAIIWKGALMAAQIKENTKEIDELKRTVDGQNKQVLDSLTQLNASITEIKVDLAELKALRKGEKNE